MAVSDIPREQKLQERLEAEREAFRVATVPDYKALETLIAAAGPADDF